MASNIEKLIEDMENYIDTQSKPAAFSSSGLSAEPTRGPRRKPGNRLRWGEPEPRNERAFAIGGSEGYGAGDGDEPPAPAPAAPDMGGMY